MRLTRHILKYLYIYYLPSGLFVVVSWVKFLDLKKKYQIFFSNLFFQFSYISFLPSDPIVVVMSVSNCLKLNLEFPLSLFYKTNKVFQDSIFKIFVSWLAFSSLLNNFVSRLDLWFAVQSFLYFTFFFMIKVCFPGWLFHPSFRTKNDNFFPGFDLRIF